MDFEELMKEEKYRNIYLSAIWNGEKIYLYAQIFDEIRKLTIISDKLLKEINNESIEQKYREIIMKDNPKKYGELINK